MVTAVAVTTGLFATACGADDARDTGLPAPPSPVETTVPADTPPPEPPPSPVGWRDDVRKAPAAGKVGPDGDCKFPGNFQIPAKWTVQSIPGVVDEGMELRCIIDGQPAGIFSAIQVWVVADGTQPKAVLEKFVRKSTLQSVNVEYRETKIGDATGVEVTYQSGHHATRAFAVGGSGQVTMVTFGAEEEDYDKGLPSYVLARSTYTATG